jgi:tetracycline repressor-like protein
VEVSSSPTCFDRAAAASSVFPGGCVFASVEAEFDTHPGPVKDKIASIQRQWSGRLEQLISEAQTLGKLRADEDPSQLAFELDAYMLMGNTAFVLHDDPGSPVWVNDPSGTRRRHTSYTREEIEAFTKTLRDVPPDER